MKKLILASFCFAMSQGVLCMQMGRADTYLLAQKAKMVNLITQETSLDVTVINTFVNKVAGDDLNVLRVRTAFGEDWAIDCMKKLLDVGLCDGAAKLSHAAHRNQEFRAQLLELLNSTTTDCRQKISYEKTENVLLGQLAKLRVEAYEKIQLSAAGMRTLQTQLNELNSLKQQAYQDFNLNSDRAKFLNDLIVKEQEMKLQLAAANKKTDEYLVLSREIEEAIDRASKRYKKTEYVELRKLLDIELLEKTIESKIRGFAKIEQ